MEKNGFLRVCATCMIKKLLYKHNIKHNFASFPNIYPCIPL